MSIFDYPDVTLKPSINQDRQTPQRLVKITYNTSKPATNFKFDKKTFDYDIMFIDMSKNKIWNPRGQQRQRQRQQNVMREKRKKDVDDDQMSIQLNQENSNKRENKDYQDLTPKGILDQISLDIKPMVEEKVEKPKEAEEDREQMEQNSSLWISKQELKKIKKQEMGKQKEQQEQQQQQQSQVQQQKQRKKYKYQQQASGSEIDNSMSNSQIDGFTHEFCNNTIGEHSKQNMSIFTKSDKNKNSYIQKQNKSDIKMQSLQISQINNNESAHQILQLLNKIESDAEDQPNKQEQTKKLEREAKIKQIESLPFKNISYQITAQNCKKIILKSVVDFDGLPLKAKKKRNYINITQRQIQVMRPQVEGLEWNVGQSKIKTAPVMLKVVCYCCRAQRQAEYNQDNTCFVLCCNPECTKQICLQFTPKQL